jgi:hypothetical protein
MIIDCVTCEGIHGSYDYAWACICPDCQRCYELNLQVSGAGGTLRPRSGTVGSSGGDAAPDRATPPAPDLSEAEVARTARTGGANGRVPIPPVGSSCTSASDSLVEAVL